MHAVFLGSIQHGKYDKIYTAAEIVSFNSNPTYLFLLMATESRTLSSI